LAAGSALVTLLTPLLTLRWAAWTVTLVVLGADLVVAVLLGPPHPLFFIVNNLALLLLVVGITVLWAQSGLRARDAAILGGALAAYDVIATSFLPLTTDLINRLATLPLAPVVGWGTGVDGAWVGIGLGDLLLATAFPLVQRKSYGRAAGLAALAIGLGTIGILFILGTLGLLRGTFPVMVVLGPLIVLQFVTWRGRHGAERTTWEYLHA
jgi:hypothetical protein